MVDFCSKSKSTLKFFTNVVEQRETIEHNYKMMQLYSPQMSIQAKDFVCYAVENFECDFSTTTLLGMMREDGFGELNWEQLKAHLNRISRQCHKELLEEKQK